MGQDRQRDNAERDGIDGQADSLKRRLQELTGEPVVSFESAECSSELREQFWRNVLEFEGGTHIEPFQFLVESGCDLPAPDAIDGSRLTRKL